MFRLNKNRELIGEDFYGVCLEKIEEWYKNVYKEDYSNIPVLKR